MRFLLIYLFTFQLFAAGYQLVDEIKDPQDGRPIIPYQKYVLDNGLTLIIHEDHSDPLVDVSVTYHVGSARELPNRTGFAHFFEHMMFEGSQHVSRDQVTKIGDESGGIMNGGTNKDFTNYFVTAPKNYLEKLLWMEADRMGFLLPAVTQKKFETQREIVKNERRQRYELAPYGLVYEKIGQALYPASHPYSWQTIGYFEDLNSASLTDLKSFFLNWYGPNNATLVVAGDVKPEKALSLVKKYFGSIPRGPEVPVVKKDKVQLPETRYISYEDPNIKLPAFIMSFPTVHHFHPDEAPLDIVAAVLGQGKDSILYQRLVKTGKAVQASVSHGCSELSCSFDIMVIANLGQSLQEIEQEVRLGFKEFETRGVKTSDLKKFQSQYYVQTVEGLEKVHAKAQKLAFYETYFGNPNLITEDLERYHRVRKRDLKKAYKHYLKSRPSVILSVYPKGRAALVAHADTFHFIRKQLPLKAQPKGKPLDIIDSFDRSKAPAVADFSLTSPDEFWIETLENGVEVIGSYYQELPLVAGQITLTGGQQTEAASQAGLTCLMVSMLKESTQNFSIEKLQKELDLLGSSIAIECRKSEVVLGFKTLKKNYQKTLELVKEKLLRPRFDPTEFEKVKRLTYNQLLAEREDPQALGKQAFNFKLYGAQEAIGLPLYGTAEKISQFQLDDIKKHYQKWFQPQLATVSLIGQLSQQKLLKGLEIFNDWKKGRTQKVTAKNFPPLEKTKIVFLAKPGLTQSVIMIGRRVMKFNPTGEWFKLSLANYPLGGGLFSNRLMQNLRQEKAYTYGIGSYVTQQPYAGALLIPTKVRANVTVASVKEILKELKNYTRKGMTKSELAFMKKSLSQRTALSSEGLDQSLSKLDTILRYNNKQDYTLSNQALLNSITRSELNRLSRKYLRTQDLVIVVVGDPKYMSGLKGLGYPLQQF